jgi:PAS domain S-box-containing protein
MTGLTEETDPRAGNGNDDASATTGALREENARLRALVEELDASRRRAEAALEESRARLADALNTAHMATWSWNVEEDFVTTSESMSAVCGISDARDFDSRSFGHALVHPDDRDRHGAIVEAALGRGEGWHDEYRIIRPCDGELAWLEERAIVTKDSVTSAMRAMGLVWDITERKRAEDALRDSEAKYRSMFDSIDEGFVVLETLFDEQRVPADFRILENNPAHERLTGLYGAAGRGVRELLPDLEEEWLHRIGAVALTGEPMRFEGRVETLDRWFDVYASRLTDEEKPKIAVVFNDTTARKLAEAALREREAQQTLLVRLGDAMRSIVDPFEIQETAARLLGQHLGVDRVYYCEVVDDIIHVQRDYARGVPSLIGSYPFERWGRKVVEAYRRGENCAVNDVHTHPLHADEDVSPYEAAQITSGMMISLPKSKRWGAILGVTDRLPRNWTDSELQLAVEVAERTWAAVERARAESALRESEAQLQTITSLVPDLLWSNDPTGLVDWYNDRFGVYTGRSVEESVGHGWMEPVHPDDRAAARSNFLDALASGRPFRHENRIRNAAGEYRWFLLQAEPLRDPQGNIIRWYGAATDIHEERNAREELERRVRERTRELAELSVQRQQLLERLVAATEEERQRVARELHDEMGQHITALKVGLETLDAPDEALARMKGIVTQLDESVDRLALELRPPALDDVGLCGAISSLTEQFSAASGIRVDLHVSGADDVRLPEAVETAIYRVLQEALTNVWKHAGARAASVIVERTSEQLQLIVEDDGRGFDVEETLSNVASRGHLGLLGMRERLTILGGSLDIESEAGHGTTVYVRVPTRNAERSR